MKYYLQKKTHQDIIRFDVCMDEVALLHESEREEQLLRVALDGLQMESHIVAVLLQQFTQVHTVSKSKLL